MYMFNQGQGKEKQPKTTKTSAKHDNKKVMEILSNILMIKFFLTYVKNKKKTIKNNQTF